MYLFCVSWAAILAPLFNTNTLLHLSKKKKIIYSLLKFAGINNGNIKYSLWFFDN